MSLSYASCGPTPLPCLDAPHVRPSSHTTNTTDDPTDRLLRITYRPIDERSQSKQEQDQQQWIQQPVTESMAKLEGLLQPWSIYGASAMAVNTQFGCYAVKNGLIRVNHSNSAGGMRTLLRAHSGQTVTDLQFFQDGDILASVSHYLPSTSPSPASGTSSTAAAAASSKVVIWRVYEDPRVQEIAAEIMLEISTPHWQMTRVVWHPFNANQFWVLYSCQNTDYDGTTTTTRATLVESTRIATTPTGPHAVAVFATPHLLVEGATVLLLPPQDQQDDAHGPSSRMNDLCWNAHDPRYVMTGHDDGSIRLWDLQQTTPRLMSGAAAADGTTCTCPAVVKVVQCPSGSVSRCLFLPYENAIGTTTATNSAAPRWTTCFLTGSQRNRTVTLWSAWEPHALPPQPLQQITLGGAVHENDAFVLSICHGPATPPPPSQVTRSSYGARACFIVACSTTQGRLYVLHCRGDPPFHTNTNPQQHQQQPALLLLRGCDYVVPFRTAFPTYSLDAQTKPSSAEDDDDDMDYDGEYSLSNPTGWLRPAFDMKLFVYQSSAVQSLTLTPTMVQPPRSVELDANGTVPGVKVERPVTNTAASTVERPVTNTAASTVAEELFEEYDVDEDDDDSDVNYDDAPDPSTLPSPNGIMAQTTSKAVTATSVANTHNPFNNWLGAIAATTATSTTTQVVAPPPPPTPVVAVSMPSGPFVSSSSNNIPAPPPIPTIATSSTAVGGSSSGELLSPMDMLFPNANKSMYGSSSSNDGILSAAPVQPMPPPPPMSAVATSSGNSTPVVDNTHPTTGVVDRTAMVLANEMHRAVHDNIRDSVLPMIRQTVLDGLVATAAAQTKINVTKSDEQEKREQQQITQLVAAALQPLQQSVDALTRCGVSVDHNQVAQAVGGSVAEPLRAAFAESVEAVLLPTLESVTGQVLRQVSDHLDRQHQETVGQFRQQYQSDHAERDVKLDAMSHQLSTMTALVAELTKEVQSLRQVVVASAERAERRAAAPQQQQQPIPPPPPPPPPVDPTQALRDAIVQLLQEKKYEEAFTKAVSTGTVDMTVFCCHSADLQEVLGGSQPVLSQPILLCVMQQLGAVLGMPPQHAAKPDQKSDPTLEILDWLQEIALSINPADPTIQRHVPTVLQQVVHHIQQRIEAPDLPPNLRRPLQRMLQVVRGVQMG